MARTIQVGGYETGIPGSYQNSIQRTAPSNSGPLPTGIVAILGECEGEIAPNTPTRFRLGAGAYLKKQLNKGPLYDAARLAFKPSRNDPNEVRGASEVLAIRVNVALQSSSTLTGTGPVDLITLTSRGYGIAQNGLARTIAAGTLGAYGKKLTLSRPGYVDEVKDNLGFLPAFIIRYTGNGSTATMTITRTSLATTLAGDESDGSANLSCAFSTYDTVQKLVDYINAQTGYEAIIVTKSPSAFLCQNLDFVTAADIKLVDSGSVSLASTTTTSMTLASVTAGNVVRLGAGVEYVYVSATGSPNTVIRGFLDSTPAIHSSADADEFYAATSVNQAIIEWANASSQHVTAARHADYAVGTPAVAAKTYFTGGSEGSTPGATQYENALKELQKRYVNLIVLTDTTAAVHAKLADHMDWRWGKGGMECIAHVGAAQDETYAQIKTRAKALQDSNIALWFQDVTRDDDLGVSTVYAPWAMGALAAGIQAGTPFGEGLEYKTLDVGELGQSSTIDMTVKNEDCVEDGISFGGYWDGEWRIVRCLSTWTQNDDHEKIEMNVRRSLAHTLYKTRLRVKADFLGKGQRKNNANSIKSSLRSALEDIRDKDKAIVEGSKLVNNRREIVPAFEILPVEVNGNVAGYSYRCTPTGSTTFLVGDTFVNEFQDVAG